MVRGRGEGVWGCRQASGRAGRSVDGRVGSWTSSSAGASRNGELASGGSQVGRREAPGRAGVVWCGRGCAGAVRLLGEGRVREVSSSSLAVVVGSLRAAAPLLERARAEGRTGAERRLERTQAGGLPFFKLRATRSACAPVGARGQRVRPSKVLARSLVVAAAVVAVAVAGRRSRRRRQRRRPGRARAGGCGVPACDCEAQAPLARAASETVNRASQAQTANVNLALLSPRLPPASPGPSSPSSIMRGECQSRRPSWCLLGAGSGGLQAAFGRVSELDAARPRTVTCLVARPAASSSSFSPRSRSNSS